MRRGEGRGEERRGGGEKYLCKTTHRNPSLLDEMSSEGDGRVRWGGMAEQGIAYAQIHHPDEGNGTRLTHLLSSTFTAGAAGYGLTRISSRSSTSCSAG